MKDLRKEISSTLTATHGLACDCVLIILGGIIDMSVHIFGLLHHKIAQGLKPSPVLLPVVFSTQVYGTCYSRVTHQDNERTNEPCMVDVQLRSCSKYFHLLIYLADPKFMF